VLDLHSRRLLASVTSDHPDADLACDAIKIAAAVRGGRAAVDGVIFHTDRGSTYTATVFTTLCRKLGVSQSMGRVGSCFDNAAAEAFFSTLEHEVLSPAPFHHQSPGTPGRGGVVPGLLQHPAPAQLGDAPSRSARRGRTAPPHYCEGGGPRGQTLVVRGDHDVVEVEVEMLFAEPGSPSTPRIATTLSGPEQRSAGQLPRQP